MNYIDNHTWTYFLKLLQQVPDISSVGLRSISAFRGKVIKFFEVGIEHNFLLVDVFEGPYPKQGLFAPGYDVNTGA
jgi:hypothetical protein